MKYRKDGRTYKLVRGVCNRCAFDVMTCAYVENTQCGIVKQIRHKIWRETIPSKIRNWLKGVSKPLKSTGKVE